MKTLRRLHILLALIVLTIVALLVTGCADEAGATKALLDRGYTNVVVRRTSSSAGCLDFTAIGLEKTQVRGVICQIPSGYYIKVEA